MTADQSRQTYLLPADDSLLRIGDLSATPPTNVVDLPARIGFLGVNADLTGLSLDATGNDPAVQLVRADDAGGPLRISELLTDDGALRPELLEVRSNVTAGIAFTATERPLVPLGTQYASGVDGPASGEASVSWGPQGSAVRHVRSRLRGPAGLRPRARRLPVGDRTGDEPARAVPPTRSPST